MRASSRSSDMEFRMADSVLSTLENIRSGSHDDTGSVAKILRSMKTFGYVSWQHTLSAAIAVSGTGGDVWIRSPSKLPKQTSRHRQFIKR
jgi:hypothetical protein